MLDKDIYSYGKSFGSYEIDLITEPIPPSYVIETKIYKNIRELETIERCVTKDFIQLTEYLDKEPGSPPYGILVIYNFTDVLIKGPRHWIQKRIWILPINISQITPSRRSKSIAIEESDTKNLIRCILLDAQPKKSR